MSGHVLLIGATGGTGRQIVAKAREAGLELRLLARRPEKVTHDAHLAFQGDVLDPASLHRAVKGASVVVSALGTPLILRGPVTLLSEGSRNLVQAIQSECPDARLLCITGMGAGDSVGHGGFLYDRVLLPLLLGRIYADKNRQEQVVMGSPLDWTLIRPAMLTDAPPKGSWREITSWAGEGRMTKISRADVATFIVREIGQPRHHRTVVNLSE
ncbi:MAG: SDR family oxidoreductase [Pseudomonadota bacterium]